MNHYIVFIPLRLSRFILVVDSMSLNNMITHRSTNLAHTNYTNAIRVSFNHSNQLTFI